MTLVIVLMSLLISYTTASTPVTEQQSQVVTLEVTLPSGEVRQLSAVAGEQVTTKLSDDSEFGFRPRIRETDSSQIEVTISKIGSPDEPVGTVEVRVGESPVDAKTTPVLKIAVSKVTSPDRHDSRG